MKQTIYRVIMLLMLLMNTLSFSAPSSGTQVWEIAVDDLDKICTIASKTDTIQENIVIVQSTIDRLTSQSLSEEILTKLCAIDSKIDQLSVDLSSDVDGLQIAIMIAKECVLTVDSKVDALDLFIQGSVESKLCVIDSKIDGVDDQIELLQLTMNTIESKICVLADSKLDTIGCDTSKLCNIDSKVDKIIDDLRCTPTVITEAGTISTPGNYCLANDIAGIVTIDAPRVNLDLNGKQVLGTISLTSDANTVSIMNGIIDGDGASGIERLPIGPSISNLHISDITIINAMDGMLLNSISKLWIKNVSVFDAFTNVTIATCDNIIIEDSVFNNATATGLLMTSCSEIEIRRCVASNNVSTGILLSGCTRSIIEDCRCDNQMGLGSSGVAVDSMTPCHRLINVTASGNNTGFFLNAPEIVCTRCFACSNGDPMDSMTAGFVIDGPSTRNVCVENCIAKNNTTGFRTGMSTTGVLKNNIAIDNTVCGFNDDTAAFPSTFTYVGNVALRNGGGFSFGNYCVGGFPLVPGMPPFSQVISFDAVSSWNNITA